MHPVKRLRHERRILHVTQTTVATLTKVPQSLLSLAETGRYVPTPEQLAKLSQFFRVPADELLEDVIVMDSGRQ